MDVVYSHVCGLDVHKKTVVTCIITPDEKEIRTFSTMTDDLLQMVDWIKSKGCTHAAMESTGSYWKPVYNLLETEEIQTLVVNAQHIKHVPGRKTDVKDAEWIASLLRHGLLRGSFIPPRDQRELRELIRYRRSLIEERAREVNRIQKVLEGANIKLSSVASDILGKSARAMIEALIAGNVDPESLSELALRRLKNKKADLQRALKGLIGPHQRLMLQTQLRHVDELDALIQQLDEEIKRRMLPFEEDLERLDTIPGVARRTAEQIVAETGTDMSRFPSAAHLCSWAGLAPGNNESAGKRKSVFQQPRGLRFVIGPLLILPAAHKAPHLNPSYLSVQFCQMVMKTPADPFCFRNNGFETFLEFVEQLGCFIFIYLINNIGIHGHHAVVEAFINIPVA
jgi:transposase